MRPPSKNTHARRPPGEDYGRPRNVRLSDERYLLCQQWSMEKYGKINFSGIINDLIQDEIKRRQLGSR